MRYRFSCRVSALLFWAAWVVLPLGCGSGDQGPKLYQVHGKVQMDGQPLEKTAMLETG